MKSEPSAYSWADLLKDGRTCWDGVRNFQARRNLETMRKGDAVLFYHSVEGKAVVGIARVDREAYPDPKDKDWVAVDLEPDEPLARPVTLDEIKSHPALRNMALVRQSRLSVMPVTDAELRTILALAGRAASSEKPDSRKARSKAATRKPAR